MEYTVAIIGTGADPGDPDTDGYAMAYRHAAGYHRLDAAKELLAERVPFLSATRVGPATFVDRVIEDVVTALDTGMESELAADNALRATELIFACWESVRRRGRVDLPLDVDDNPLASMVEDGQVALTAGEAGD